MKVVTWNVNGIRARQARVLPWAIANAPDVLCLQEIKCLDEQFPSQEWKDAGYHVETYGQKAYNGVALLSRFPLGDVTRGFAGDPLPDEHRVITATIQGIKIASIYVPNGKSVGSSHYQGKLGWLDAFAAHVSGSIESTIPALLCGDYNVAPESIDVYDPAAFEGQTLFSVPERERLARIIASHGMIDVLRHFHPAESIFTWWDYRMLGFPKNRGLRIDHILATPALKDRMRSAQRDREARKGPDPSDHAPVFVELA